MSILGYSTAYFLPEYWSNTPLYGEKIIPLLDYMLSTEYSQADKLANAFYNIQNKYKNPQELPIAAINSLINENGYGYVRDLLGEDEETLKLLVYLLVLVHQLKGTKLGIEVVLNLLKRDTKALVMGVVGNPTISPAREASGFSASDYILYNGFTVDAEPFELTFQIRTTDFNEEQTIASANSYGFYLGVDIYGKLVLNVGSKARNKWDIVNREVSNLALSQNTSYYVKLAFDGFAYTVRVSTDNKKYVDYVNYTSTIPTEIHNGIVYIGVDNSTPLATPSKPFRGFINLGPFSLDVENVVITEWFEQFPVGEENTFIIKADLDLGVVNTDFFKNFAIFVSKYVYPTLEAFEAKLNFTTNLTFLPYCRQRITYVASGDFMRDHYYVKEQEVDPEATIPLLVKNGINTDMWYFDVIAE